MTEFRKMTPQIFMAQIKHCTAQINIIRLFKQFAFRDVQQNYFSYCVVNNWNSLPCSIVEAHSIDEFKKHFDYFNNDIMFSIDL